MKVSRRRELGKVFRFLWPWEWDKPDGDKPSKAEDLTDTLLIAWLEGFSCHSSDTVRRKAMCKQINRNCWWAGWFHGEGKLGRRNWGSMWSRRRMNVKGMNRAYQQDDWSASLTWELTKVCRLCWYGRSCWKQGGWSCLLTWQPLPKRKLNWVRQQPLWKLTWVTKFYQLVSQSVQFQSLE